MQELQKLEACKVCKSSVTHFKKCVRFVAATVGVSRAAGGYGAAAAAS